ncbi:hypothetical protein SAMN05421759_109105 [Roseivivax lentus]|uniref:Type II toxin-antitoxin system RelE/ParE family toxin n=1 Tax=Roseivivax lentus TaxID=633194 RepID=A0A1N7NPN6_9RHOB|nr:hypothetical protein SAMN05421759_109105 [Roseivivax lentus]
MRAIYRFLVKTHHESFGHDLASADAQASLRIDVITRSLERIANAPHMGTRITTPGGTFRFVSFDRTVYWFRLKAETETVVVESIFHGGQDHLGRMMARLMAEGDG